MSTTPVKRETSQLNFEYTFKKQEKQNSRLVAILKPSFQQNSYNDGGPLSIAISNSLYELFSKKGFRTSGPYSSDDDLTYGEKKTVYLVGRPELFIHLKDNASQPTCSGAYCTQEGAFAISGEFYVKLYEPLSGQTVINKRINLSDFGIQKNYTRQWENQQQQKTLIGALIDAANQSNKPDQLVDNYEKAKNDALNEFFSRSMEKLEAHISSQEILAYSKDIAELKEKKRY
jgi:neuraminyllactose-binding hemagglutinin